MGFSGGTPLFASQDLGGHVEPGDELQPIVLDNVRCDGTETRLIDCEREGNKKIGEHNCMHDEDSGVACADPGNDNANLFSLSLSDVEIGGFSAAVTNYVTAAAHSVTETTVNAVATHTGATVRSSPGSPVSLSVGENTIAITVIATDGTTPNVYTVTVNREGPPQDGNLRILNGGTRGLLEIYYEGEWGTVCDDYFVDVDAGVACRQMGFSEGTQLDDGFQVGQNQPIFLDNVRCDGTETRLIDCDHRWEHNCVHNEDVGVDCSDPVRNYPDI